MAFALSLETVTKEFRGARAYAAFRDDLAQLVTSGRRRARETVKALEDVSLEIAEGESFGLIGLNGAGKTTLLKLASRIAYPTSGRIRVRGRVGALIEVGTGMHPELTGRENVDLYGRILGFSRADIRKRFDEIVAFADIGPALEQPVKQFSSGMQLRLGFALASHLEPDVLLIDEAIAVGDAGFQYRCVERMGELVRSGRTLLFVSHNMGAIETLCTRAVMLDSGRVAADGPASDVVHGYLARVEADLLADEGGRNIAGERLEITRVSVHDADGHETATVGSGEAISVRLHYHASTPIPGPIFSVGLSDGRIGVFALASMLVDGETPTAIEGSGYIECAFAPLPLMPRTYEIWGSVRHHAGFGDLVDWQRLGRFAVTGDLHGQGKSVAAHVLANAPVRIPYEWRHAAIEPPGSPPEGAETAS